jgi:heme-degrading monooxygenase HmoA/quinol monooxygenase YgiN
MKHTKRTSIINIRDPHCGAVIPSQWTLQTADAQRAAAEAALSAMPAAPGLLCFSLFRGLDDFTLFLLSQWIDEPARDTYIAVSSKPRAVVDEALPNIERDWRHPSSLYRSFIGDQSAGLGCLVVVRQPLKGNDHQIQRNWADTAIAALESQVEPAPGLGAASFFLSTDGTHVFNLGEWKSADAHRSWLSREQRGESPEWQAVLSHPGAASGGDVRRYEFLGAVEPVES